jgi:hypothetical protein
MAKKPSVDAFGKVRLELRLDAELYQRLQAVAEKTPVSINQLVQGITRWAVGKAHPGESAELGWTGQEHDVAATDTSECVWFGEYAGEDVEQQKQWEGEIYFQLDFSERRVVQEPERPGKDKTNARPHK